LTKQSAFKYCNCKNSNNALFFSNDFISYNVSYVEKTIENFINPFYAIDLNGDSINIKLLLIVNIFPNNLLWFNARVSSKMIKLFLFMHMLTVF